MASLNLGLALKVLDLLNRLTPACSAIDTDLLDLIYVPINLAVDFKEIAEDSVKTFINST